MRPYNLNGGRPGILNDEQRKYIRSNLKKSLRVVAKELGVGYQVVYYSLKPKKNGNVRG